MSKINVSVSLDDEHIDQILEVAHNLESAGMKVENMMSGIGVLTGSCDSEKIEVLARVEGVSAVEPERRVQIAPPESEIQ
ncbi:MULTISPECIES: ketohydroxyglutarate aldolase [unclassified Coleofasciculus]|uniref:ketohydroxyglutarate aldolase n=1 Tax=unclassified Coleofasciculus TaxID=2692782 RepID=UPI001880F8A1|nr:MULTISPECIES: ketohydroxyglutarate aldolase [unclassified Coleofasciculus]MBE9124625.1 ketohydroxyglutarate aldolase [Coleofasciculus sp. LEGE 07081]MBE9147589.1 ketohydroxyglutarate aldolase [Coleofasciculus sp. LEGE 07092]